MVVEPEIVHRRHVAWLKQFYWRFHRVFSAIEHLVNSIPNGVFFPFGSTWVPNWRQIDVTKKRMVSLIASAKRSQPGHFPRHEIAEWAATEGVELDAIGHGYQPFDKKWEGLAPYRFSVVTENSIEPNYFTEKLIDAILCETVPIYLGCPNICRFLDTRGMIICRDTQDIKRALLSVSDELYQEIIPYLRRAKEEAARLGDTEKRAAAILLDNS